MADLKPCPFCGGEAYQKTAYPCDPDGLEMNMYIVGCKNCDIEFSRLWNEAAVIEAWNTRKTEEAVIKKLEDKRLTSQSARMEASIGMCGESVNYYSGEIGAYGEAIEVVKNGGGVMAAEEKEG